MLGTDHANASSHCLTGGIQCHNPLGLVGKLRPFGKMIKHKVKGFNKFFINMDVIVHMLSLIAA